MKIKNNKKVSILISIILIVLAVIGFSLYHANNLDYKELGETFLKINQINQLERIGIFVVSFILSFFAIQITNFGIKNGLDKHLEVKEKTFIHKYSAVIALAISVVVGYLAQEFLHNQILTLLNLAKFGKNDPIYGLDYSYFMQGTPVIMNILKTILVYILGLLIYVTTMYVYSINKYTDGVSFEELKNSKFLKQILNILYFAGFAIVIYAFLSHQDILVGDMLKNRQLNGIYLTGAGSIDITVKLWGLRIVTILFLVSVFRFIKGIKTDDSKKIISSILITPISIVVLFSLVFVYEKITLNISELDKEKQYIENNINSTIEGYGLNISNNEIANSEELTSEEVKTLKDTIGQIPITSENVIQASLKENKEYKGVYKFKNSKLMYNKDGFVYVTPREIDSETEKTISDKIYNFTHGNFAVVTNTKNLTAAKEIENNIVDYEKQVYNGIEIKEPRIYYGLNTINTAIVKSKFGKESDYPVSLTEFAKNEYNGNGGLTLSLLDKIALAIKTQNINILFNTNFDEDTKVLINRELLSRVHKAVPNFVYDKNPYLVVGDEGKVYWLVDGYTLSDRYPYSQKLSIEGEKGGRERINYIRNSVKVLVDAYNGSMEYYLTDNTDPMAMTVNNMYPELFKDYSELSNTIKDQIVYPEYLFDLQARALAIYHNSKADTIYRADDLWRIGGATNQYIDYNIQSDYVLVKEKNEDVKLGLVSTYTQNNKKAITAYLVGQTHNGNNHLKLNSYAQNNKLLVKDYISSQIENDTRIQEELKKVYSGQVGYTTHTYDQLVPINNSMLYVKTIYQAHINANTEPVLKKIIVSNGSKVAIGDTIQTAVANLFTDGAVSIDINDYMDVNVMVEAVIKQNNELEKSIKANNLEYIGKDVEKLKSLIKQLEEAKKADDLKKQEEAKLNQTKSVNEKVELDSTKTE